MSRHRDNLTAEFLIKVTCKESHFPTIDHFPSPSNDQLKSSGCIQTQKLYFLVPKVVCLVLSYVFLMVCLNIYFYADNMEFVLNYA